MSVLTNSNDPQTKPSSNDKGAGVGSSRLPKIFIASSSKALEQAMEIKRRLEKEQIAQVVLWQDSIPAGEFILEGLRNFAATVDFAVVLFTGDDEMAETGALDPNENPNSTQRETLTSEKQLAPRDNCIFELGLFMGALGLEPRRALLVRTRNSELLSDLQGIIYAEWPLPDDPPKKREAAIKRAIEQIKASVRLLGYCFNHPPRTEPRIIPKDRLMDLEKRKPGGQLLDSDAVEVLIHTSQPLELDHDLARTVCENMRGDISYSYFFYADDDGVQFFSSLVSTLAAALIDPPPGSGRIYSDGWRDLMRSNEESVSKVLETMRYQLRVYFKSRKPDIEFCVHNARHDNDAICYLRHSADSFVEWYKGKSAKYIADELKATCPPPRKIIFRGSGGWHLYDEENRKFLDLLKEGVQRRFPDGPLTNKAMEICFGDKTSGQ
jgi:predicted nucleotide-binding protein